MVTHFLRSWRERRGLTQDVLAAKAGTFGSVISRFESGDRAISLEMAVRLCRALDITLIQLLEDPDHPRTIVTLIEAKAVNPEKLADFDRTVKALAKGLFTE